MKKYVGFNLQEHVLEWEEQIKREPAVTEIDIEELKSHLLDLIDDLRTSGLDDEEAFWVASKRIGIDVSSVLIEEYKQENNSVIQMRRSLIILAGVLAYFLCYYFILVTSKVLFIILLFAEDSGYKATEWVSRYLVSWHFGVLLFLASTFFLEKKTIAFIEKIKMKFKHTIILLLSTVIFAVADTCLYAVMKNLIGEDISLKSKLIHIFLYFGYSFPLIICIGFVFIYFKYYKKTKI